MQKKVKNFSEIFFLIIAKYGHTASQKCCIINLTQQNLADCTGLSVKTISRSLRELETSSYITRSDNKILISEEQYQQMKLLIRQKYE